MRILLVCAGGASTGLLMQKMEKYAKENQKDLTIHATGIGSYERQYKDYDVILLGPQIGYQLKNVQAVVDIPCAIIQSLDYGLQNSANIYSQAETLLKK